MMLPSFIVILSWRTSSSQTVGSSTRTVSDFGFSTCDAISSDFDCGSAPYMSYECRNNVAPMYKPRAADVWSLGVVLITMYDGCSSFEQYLAHPTNFFMRQFTGMTLPVANFLVDKVFCILEDPTNDSQRIGARELVHGLGSYPLSWQHRNR
ncbi:hypothetical protein BJV74DRAFT_857110 [Russula compacta]|nr:hypothetical protein BJV74DRAFT_857110 [Russula compacta]